MHRTPAHHGAVFGASMPWVPSPRMTSTVRNRLDRVAAWVALASLFGGVGVLGWLLGHAATYDATGRDHHHGSHAYMQPLQQGGALVAVVGIALALFSVALGRHALARWVERWHRSGSMLPWLAAAVMPTAAFAVVEHLEGSIPARGLELLVIGLPLQAAIGLLVLVLVRSLLTVLVLVADRITGALRVGPWRGKLRAGHGCSRFHAPRVAPMASNAALRAPPRLAP